LKNQLLIEAKLKLSKQCLYVNPESLSELEEAEQIVQLLVEINEQDFAIEISLNYNLSSIAPSFLVLFSQKKDSVRDKDDIN
jgi:hypothetical protein